LPKGEDAVSTQDCTAVEAFPKLASMRGRTSIWLALGGSFLALQELVVKVLVRSQLEHLPTQLGARMVGRMGQEVLHNAHVLRHDGFG
jgi:hypothetical protein